jgi:hypothetical protein
MVKDRRRFLGFIEKNPRTIIFIIATLVRCIIGYIFYGSIDVSAFIGINAHTFNNTLYLHPFSIWCSFPVIPFYLWFCGFLGVNTCLPLAFCFKLIPIFFDGLLAVLLYDLIKNIRSKHAFTAGMLYALSPFSIIITCIHGAMGGYANFFFFAGFVYPYVFSRFIKSIFFMDCFCFFISPKTIITCLYSFFFAPWSRFKKDLGRLYEY